MGCVNSKVEEETVRRSRERKRLMKQLISCRSDLAKAHLAYLRSLKNIGATLQQFAKVESLMIPVDPSVGLQLPPSPPPSLPPSPPPLPQFYTSPKVTKPENEVEEEGVSSKSVDDFANENCLPPPPPVQGYVLEFWDPFGPSSSSNSSSKEEGLEEENWAEANAEFKEEEEEKGGEEEGGEGKNVACVEGVALDLEKEKTLGKETLDDNSSAMSLLTKDTDVAMVVWRAKKSLAGIVKEIDDYFLKAAAGGNEVLLLLESDHSRHLHWMEEARGNILLS